MLEELGRAPGGLQPTERSYCGLISALRQVDVLHLYLFVCMCVCFRAVRKSAFFFCAPGGLRPTERSYCGLISALRQVDARDCSLSAFPRAEAHAPDALIIIKVHKKPE